MLKFKTSGACFIESDVQTVNVKIPRHKTILVPPIVRKRENSNKIEIRMEQTR